MTTPPTRPPLTGRELRGLAEAADPGFGQDLSEDEWDQMAERLMALARLLWRIRRRKHPLPSPPSPSEPARAEPRW